MGERRLAEAKALLARLIAFDSVSDSSNLPLVDFVEGYLRGHGLEARQRAERGRRQGRDPRHDRASHWTAAVVLSGQGTDVVPVEGQPGRARRSHCARRPDALAGRGACDMKSFDACVLAMSASAFRDAGLKRPVHIVLSYDEETTCLGSARRYRQVRQGRAASGWRSSSASRHDDGGRRRAQERGDRPTLVTGHEAHSALPALG